MEAEQTLISNLYLCLGERGQDELHNRKPHLDLATTRYPRVLDEFESVFRKERNETFETYQLLSRKQRDGETLEEFHSVLSGLAARCSLGTLERRVLRDVFIVNMSNKEAQTELCRSTKTPDEVYRIALSYERGDKYAKSYKVSGGGLTAAPAGSLQIKAEPISAIRGGYRRPFQRGGRGFGRGGTRGRGGAADRKCYNCDQSSFTPDHIPKCPARNVTCNFCKKMGHYERTCRGRRSANRGRVGMINEDDTNGGTTQDYPEESASNYGSSVGWVTDSKTPAHGWDSDSSTEYVVMSIRRKEETELKVAGAKLALRINGKATQAWIDSGSPISIFTIGELKRTLGTVNVQLKPLNPQDDQFRDYGNNPLKFLGKMQVTLHSNGWTCSSDINVIGGCRPSIIGRDLMPSLGLMLVQAPSTEGVKSIHTTEGTVAMDNDLDEWQTHFCKQFQHLFHRVGRIRNYKVQADFFKNLTPIQQKGRRVPITLQEKVDKEIEKLLGQGHIQKLEECSDKYFVSPIVITVKKDGSVKLALESREINKQVHKNKYQMPNIEELMDIVGQTISERKQGDVFFTTMDLTYAYGQLPLNENTSKHCNFSLVGGRSTGTYRFKTGFYGLTTMPAEFQRVMHAILAEFPCAHAFIDDILVISKGTKIEHIALVEKILTKLDKENMALKLEKCQFAKNTCEWLGHRITKSGITPMVRKTDPIDKLTAPKTLSQLKSFMGSIHSLHKYLPALAETSAPLRPLLSKKNEFLWTIDCQTAFESIKKQVANIVELKHFDVHKDIRIVCDASHNGLGAVLEQLGTEGWRPISFASRFLNAAEKKYSTNELEMLAVVWGSEYFRNYIFGRKFTVVTDHKALLSLLNGNNKKNKTMFSRLTRWIDRIIPFDFVIEHMPGAKIGLADYLSRHPVGEATKVSLYDNTFTVAKLKSITNSLGYIDTNKGIIKASKESIVSAKDIQVGNDKVNIPPEEGVKTRDRRLTNQKPLKRIAECNDRESAKVVKSITESKLRESDINSTVNSSPPFNKTSYRSNKIHISTMTSLNLKKLNKLLLKHPEITSGSSSEVEIVDARLEAETHHTRDIRCNTVISIPSAFGGELFPAAYPAGGNVIMSVIPRDCKIFRKSSALPELFNLKLVEANYKGDPQMRAIKELVESKDPDLEKKVRAMGAYLGQHTHDFHVRENCLWMDERLVIPIPLRKAVVNRIHAFHHGRSSMFDAARDVWFPYLHRSLVAAADGCKECTDAGKSLKPLCAKGDVGKIYEPREPNECLQLDFWGPIRYLNESSKYVLVAVDRFSRWPSAMICGNNKSDKVLKFIKQYISQHGVPRKIFMDQGTSFTSNAVKSFCNSEGIEIIYSTVNDHRATGCVERTIGSLKNFVLTYAKEKDSGNLESMIERALSALRFAPNATLKISPFEAHHGREANTVLRNLTKKPTLQNLNWARVLKQKSAYLDSTDPRAPRNIQPMATDWEERSDVEFDVDHMNHPRRLTQNQLVSAADGTPMADGDGKQACGGKSKQPSKRTELLFQRLKDSNKRYRPINQKVIRESKHTITLANGSVLRKSGVAEKVIKSNAPTTASKLTLPLPAMSALQRRAELKRAANEQAAGTSTQSKASAQSKADNKVREFSPAEEDDSDSEYEPITISKHAGNSTIAPGRDVEGNEPKMNNDVEDGIGRPNLSEGSGAGKSQGVDTEVQTMSNEQGGSAPNLSNEGRGGKHSKKKGERVRRLRLVSYSSQESEDGTGSRKSTRKRTAVSKFGGVMIDSILKARTSKGEEDRERDTN